MDQVRMGEELPTIKVSLALPETRADRVRGRAAAGVRFEVMRGRDALSAFTVDQAALGIPDGFDPASYQGREPRFLLSGDVAGLLAGGISQLLPDGREPLWLQLASPIGYLAALPWERMLREDPVLRTVLPPYRSILRIPDFTLVLERGYRPLTVALCISDPGGEPSLPDAAVLPAVFGRALYRQEPPEVHVFADLSTYRSSAFGLTLRRGTRIFAHDPRQAHSIPPGADPWLAWVQQEMAGTPVDVVHFATHGHVDGSDPSIALAESPATRDERLWARLISPAQVAGCLTRLGAWLVGFSSPHGNLSPLGLRLFADQLARLRPGTVIHHQGDPLALTRLYQPLLRGRAADLGPGDFMYVHPRLAGVPTVSSYAESLAVEGRGVPIEAVSPAPPPWVTRTRLYLDESVAQVFPGRSEHDAAEQSPVADGVRAALRFVGEVMREHGGTPA